MLMKKMRTIAAMQTLVVGKGRVSGRVRITGVWRDGVRWKRV